MLAELILFSLMALNRNMGNDRFEDVAVKAGLTAPGWAIVASISCAGTARSCDAGETNTAFILAIPP